MKKGSKTNDKNYDVVVIGGGPAGMMAAGQSAKKGLRTLLIEKNDKLGKKLMITGGGRCNLTNAEYDIRKFLNHLGESGKFLFSPFSQFGVKDTINFFENLGLKTKIEALNRVFPVDDNASSVQKTLVSILKEYAVDTLTNSSVLGFVVEDKKITHVRVNYEGNNIKIGSKNFILACGGTSHPETGSTGDGYKWLKEIGHNVIMPEASLVPIAIKDDWAKKIPGTTLSDVKISVLQNNKRILSKNGRLLFTHFGISGPTIINMSKKIGDLLKSGKVVISLDLFPSLSFGELDEKLLKLFNNNKNKQFKNCVVEIIPSGIFPIISQLSDIEPEATINNIEREESLKLGYVLKNITMEVDKLLQPERSIVAGGGVDLKEVDFKNMSSKLYPNLFFAGDILNIERPSGGFSLQICWTTGFLAGISVK